MKTPADLIIVNAKVYTVDSMFSIVRSFAVRDGKFVGAGTSEDILKQFKAPQVIDLQGKTVIPGMIDAHCHFFGYGRNLVRLVDLSGTSSLTEVLEAVWEYSTKHPEAQWIEGRGWDQNRWPEKKFPDNALLNLLFPAKPVALLRIDGHAVLANDEALKQAGITAQTRIDGGEIQVRNGVMTGILLDKAVDYLLTFIPELTDNQKNRALMSAQKNCLAVGLTTVADAGLPFADIRLIDSMQQSGKLKMKVFAMLDGSRDECIVLMEKGPLISGRLVMRAIKLYADGALGSRGALLQKPYADDPGNYGIMVEKPESLKAKYQKALQYGFQAMTHAIGDSANKLVLNLYGEELKGHNDKRWRIEHCQVVDPADLPLFEKYSIVPLVNSTHATSDMGWAEERLGKDRIGHAYAFKSLLLQNGWLANGSDFPIESINPLLGFYAFIARKDTSGHPSGGFQMENALSREESLRAMTIWAARSLFMDDRTGSIEIGKEADFVVLDEDIMQVPEKEIPRVKVLGTFINGEKVFRSQHFQNW